MVRRSVNDDPVLEKLDDILAVLQDLLILESAKAGVRREDLRRIVPVSNDRISRIMKHVRRATNRIE